MFTLPCTEVPSLIDPVPRNPNEKIDMETPDGTSQQETTGFPGANGKKRPLTVDVKHCALEALHSLPFPHHKRRVVAVTASTAKAAAATAAAAAASAAAAAAAAAPSAIGLGGENCHAARCSAIRVQK